VLAKEKKQEELAVVLVSLLEVVRLLGVVLTPFLPASAEKILRAFGFEQKPTIKDYKWGAVKPGAKIEKSEPLFPKVEQES